MKRLIVLLAMALCSVAFAKVPDWPSDFWEKVAAHDAAIAPSGTQIGTGTADVATLFWKDVPSDHFGTADEPFSTVLPIFADSLPFWLDATAPGFLLFLR